ncbi:MAG TPA: cysteine--tRNA ligase [Acidimicrobiia bacterium]|nr:cysteine--tRNA ligase [Acidimicrobiia bacterium]
MLRLYDTAARAERELVPRDPGRVSMYVCGPTPYDVPHLGHGRTAVVFDVLRRYLEWRGLDVRFVSNVTDVEDRIIARAAERGTTEADLSAKYERVYWDELARIGVRAPDAIPHATEYIDGMQQLIAELIERGAAYVIEGSGVYFAVESYPGYGDLSHRDVADLVEGAGARVEVDERKRSPVDFALWKAAKPGEPTWDSPWGPGRPGWHIECSAMSLDLLGEGFDLHGGGDDLVFPHHENERAQAEAAGHSFARHWVHSGMVNVSGEKMSKSLGNFTTLADALDSYGARTFRMLAVQTHYRRQMEVGDAELHQARAAVERLDAFVRRAQAAGLTWTAADVDDARRSELVEAMDADLDTPEALARVFTMVRDANAQLDAGQVDGVLGIVATVDDFVERVLGVPLEPSVAVPADVEQLLQQRTAARNAKDWSEADRLRDEIEGRGWRIEDSPQGPVLVPIATE